MSDLSPPDVTELRRHAWQRPAKTDGAPAGAAEDAFGFWDLVDIVNPLQHIPVVSTIYRRITGDEIRPEARILGSTLYGGPVGMMAGVAGAVFEEVNGRSVEEYAFAMLDGEAEPPPVELAELPAEPAKAAAAPPVEAEPAPDAAPQSDAPAETAGRTADLPNGFALPPRSYAAPSVLPPADPVPDTQTLRAVPGEELAIGAGLDAALVRLAAQSAPEEASAEASDADREEPGGEAIQAAEATPADPPAHPFIVPEAGVADAMMRALDLYGQLRTAPGRPGAAGLDMRS